MFSVLSERNYSHLVIILHVPEFIRCTLNVVSDMLELPYCLYYIPRNH